MKPILAFIFVLLVLIPATSAYASPDTESLAPDAYVTQTNLDGVIGDIDEDPDSPDANWADAIATDTDTIAHVSFPTPTGNPTQGADLQNFKAWVKYAGGATNPTVQIDLYENGGLVTSGSPTTVTSSSGQMITFTWDATALGTPNGSLVEAYIHGIASGGKPADRATVSVGAVEWNVDYTVGASAPTVTTSAATNIEATTATLNGNVTNTGGENPTVTVYWGDEDGGVTPGNWDYNSAPTSPGQPQGVAAFYKNATSLPTGTTIYFNAKGTNSGGTDWGTTQSFLTKPATPTNVAATDGDHTDKVTVTWTKSTGATGYQIYRDGNALGWLGNVATGDDTGADAPTITPGTASASDGDYVDYVTLSLSGETANNGSTHSYKVRAKNATGESADSITNNGYRGVGSLTYQWMRSAADSDADYSNVDGATTDPYNDTGAPADGNGRYFKCTESAAGAASANSTADRGYRDTLSAPTVISDNATDIHSTYATLNGEITDTGGENADERGFDWGLSSGNYTDNWTEAGSFGAVVFNHEITSLEIYTTYYFRAKAHNSVGWGYGEEFYFITAGCAPNAPSELHLADLGGITISANWTETEEAIDYFLFVNRDEYPSSANSSIWEIAYSGNATSANLSGYSLDTQGFFLVFLPGMQAVILRIILPLPSGVALI